MTRPRKTERPSATARAGVGSTERESSILSTFDTFQGAHDALPSKGDNVNLRSIVTWIGAVAYLVSWFVPAVSDNLGGGSAGWQACYSAVMFGVLDTDGSVANVPVRVLMVVSSLTNVVWLFVLHRALGGMAVGDRRGRWLIAAGVLNAWWLLFFNREYGTPIVGYYVWWLSFLVVGFAALGNRPVPDH